MFTQKDENKAMGQNSCCDSRHQTLSLFVDVHQAAKKEIKIRDVVNCAQNSIQNSMMINLRPCMNCILFSPIGHFLAIDPHYILLIKYFLLLIPILQTAKQNTAFQFQKNSLNICPIPAMQQILRTDFLQSLIAAPVAKLMLSSVAFNFDEILYLINTNHTVENKFLD